MTKATKQQKQKKRQRTKQGKLKLVGDSFQQAGSSGETVACYINRYWKEDGMASIFVLRRLPRGELIQASFLIDIWCMGLKDAFGRVNITMSEFDEMLDNVKQFDTEMVRIDPEFANHLIAGGIRFAKENGFRLPRKYERWTKILGELGDIDNTDLYEFRLDGKITYEGSLKDLQKRLTGQSLEEFLKREDVQFELHNGNETHIDEEEEEFEDMLEDLTRTGVSAVQKWCFAQGIKPHPCLAEAWDLNFQSMMSQDMDLDDSDELNAERSSDNLVSLLELRNESEQQEILDALQQIKQYSSSFESSQDMLAAMGFPVDDDESDFFK